MIVEKYVRINILNKYVMDIVERGRERERFVMGVILQCIEMNCGVFVCFCLL